MNVQGGSYELDIANIVPMAFLTSSFARVAAKKSPGIDGISNAALRAAPSAMARLVHPMLVKVGWGAGEPLQRRGGALHR